ncbi:MAG: peptidylprolyl isomerase [bacterium]
MYEFMPTMRRTVLVALFFLVAGGLFLSGCESSSSENNDDITDKPVAELTDKEISRLRVVMNTNMGLFQIGLRPDWAPETCRHFIRMVRSGIYDGKRFHEVRPGVWIRGGGPGEDDFLAEPVPLEKPPEGVDEVLHREGTVGLYHPDFMPDQGGVQFYIMLKKRPQMDGGYAAFGRVVEGMGTVKRIANVPVTGKRGKPKPYKPVTPVMIQQAYLKVK